MTGHGTAYAPVDVGCFVCNARLTGAGMEAAEEWLRLHAHPKPTPWQQEAQSVIERVQKYEDEHPAALLDGTPCFEKMLTAMRAAYEEAASRAIPVRHLPPCPGVDLSRTQFKCICGWADRMRVATSPATKDAE